MAIGFGADGLMGVVLVEGEVMGIWLMVRAFISKIVMDSI